MESVPPNVGKILLYFDDCKQVVEKNKLVVEEFLKQLKSNCDVNHFFINGSTFIGVGSSYENTAASPKSDFDIAMVLPAPFTTKFFQVVKTVEAGLFKLKYNGKAASTPISVYDYINCNKYLLPEVLRDTVFLELISSIETIKYEGYTVKWTAMDSSFTVRLKKGADIIKLDIVPQIEAQVNNIPGWKGANLPLVIQNYIKKTERHILFNLSCPPHLKNMDFSHLVVQPSFNLLEKEAMLMSDVVRYLVCLFKVVSKHNKWPSKGLRSFHIKHVALQIFEEIESKYKNPWFATLVIRNKLTNMLHNGKIDSRFIKNHNIICTDKMACQTLAKEIQSTFSSISPDCILGFLEPLKKAQKENVKPDTSAVPSSTEQIMNLPLFVEGAAFNWFEMVDARFFIHKIIGEEAKYYHAFAALPEEIVMKLSDTTITQHKFSLLKEAVIKLCDTNKIEKFSHMVSSLENKDKPAIFLKEIKLIADKMGVNDDCVRKTFIESFTPSIANILLPQYEISLPMLGKLANDLILLLKSKDSDVNGEIHASFEITHRPVICSKRTYFGKKAVCKCNTDRQSRLVGNKLWNLLPSSSREKLAKTMRNPNN